MGRWCGINMCFAHPQRLRVHSLSLSALQSASSPPLAVLPPPHPAPPRRDAEMALADQDESVRIAVRALGDGRSEITYTATIRPKGVWRLGIPVFWLLFQRIAGETVRSMTDSLETL